jgi:hypothetical protein
MRSSEIGHCPQLVAGSTVARVQQPDGELVERTLRGVVAQRSEAAVSASARLACVEQPLQARTAKGTIY